jgi:hypothetical protein
MGWRRGIMKELIHFILWGTLAALASVVLLETINPNEIDLQDALKQVSQLGQIFGMTYVLIFVLEKFVLAPTVLKAEPSTVSRGLAATFGLSKVLLMLFAGTLIFQIYSNTARPELPALLKDSVMIRLANRQATHTYNWVVEQGWLSYEKVIWAAEDEQKNMSMEGQLKEQMEGFGLGIINKQLPSNLPKNLNF